MYNECYSFVGGDPETYYSLIATSASLYLAPAFSFIPTTNEVFIFFSFFLLQVARAHCYH